MKDLILLIAIITGTIGFNVFMHYVVKKTNEKGEREDV